MRADINTKMVTLIGSPLGQSFAARMQNRGYEAAGLNMIYFYTEAGSEHLGEITAGIRYMNFAGFAVTKPNKIRILEYLDGLDPYCRKAGSCNTVVKTARGKLIGYNTDGPGFYRSLTEEGGMEAKGRAFFCIGSGGAGHAVCSALAYHGAKKIYIADLYPERAETLAEKINRNFVPVAEAVAPGDFTGAASCDAVLNVSGVGMGDTVGKSPIPAEFLSPGQLCFDACYNPGRTQFLLEAKSRGCRILNGLGMSLYQGAAQIELWSGKPAPLEAMREELMRILAEIN